MTRLWANKGGTTDSEYTPLIVAGAVLIGGAVALGVQTEASLVPGVSLLRAIAQWTLDHFYWLLAVAIPLLVGRYLWRL